MGSKHSGAQKARETCVHESTLSDVDSKKPR